jgi:hypothetical protein
MKKKLLKLYGVLNSVLQLMEKNHKTWAGIKEIEKTVLDFAAVKDKMDFVKSNENSNHSDLKNKKDENRRILIGEIKPIAAILKAYAIDGKNKSLLRKLFAEFEDLKGFGDRKLLKYSGKLLKISEKRYNKSYVDSVVAHPKSGKNKDIISFGLTSSLIEKLSDASLVFKSTVDHYMEQKALIQKNQKEFANLCNEVEKKLAQKLDLLIYIFENSHPGFFKAYQLARIDKKPIEGKNKPIVKKAVKNEKPKISFTETSLKTEENENKPIKTRRPRVSQKSAATENRTGTTRKSAAPKEVKPKRKTARMPKNSTTIQEVPIQENPPSE